MSIDSLDGIITAHDLLNLQSEFHTRWLCGECFMDVLADLMEAGDDLAASSSISPGDRESFQRVKCFACQNHVNHSYSIIEWQR